ATALATQPVNPVAAQPAPLPTPRSFTDVVALLETRREARLVHHLMHHVHEARCEPGAPPEPPRARGGGRAGDDRVPPRAAGAARPRPAPRRAFRPLDRPA